MNLLLKILSFLALAVCVLVPCFYFAGVVSLESYKILFNGSSIVWFITAPFWMIKKKKAEDIQL